MPLVLTRNQVGEIRCSETVAPTLTGQANASARNHPLVLMDQGGGVMSIEHDKVGTLRAQTHGHEPLVMTKEPIPINTQAIASRSGDVANRVGLGVGKEGDPSNTLGANHCHGVYEPMQARVRKLTPVECERLQGFPDDYTKIPWKGKSAEECPDSPRYKAIGNSWAVPCVRWIGKRIQDELEKNK